MKHRISNLLERIKTSNFILMLRSRFQDLIVKLESKVDPTVDDLLRPTLCLMGGLSMLLALSMIFTFPLIFGDEHHTDRVGILLAFFLSLICGYFLFVRYRKNLNERYFMQEDGFLIVSLGWLLAGLIGALPFYLYAHFSPDQPCDDLGKKLIGYEFCSFTNAFFESVSGFSTTGASIINRGLWDSYVDGVGRLSDGSLGLPRGILLWRSVTHLLGGMGIVVLGVALLPMLGVGGLQLFRAEVTGPGPKTDKLTAKIESTARILWVTYSLMIVMATLAYLYIGKMDFYESLSHAMSTVATGGFSTRSVSVASFQSPAIEWVTIVFMLIAAMNFNLHYFAFVKKKLSTYLHDAECSAYCFTVVIVSLIIAISIYVSKDVTGFAEAIRTSLFQVLSIMTTTGYASANYEIWQSQIAIFLLTLVMLSGGCAGSTGGGIKIIRHLILFKLCFREFFYLMHPTAQKNIRINDEVVPRETIRGVASFFGLYIWISIIGTLLFLLLGEDILTSFTATISSLGNVGPGLGNIGPYENYNGLSDLGKILSALLMIMGRLELYTVLVLFYVVYWKK